MRSVFGWDLPPGVTQRMIDEAYGQEGPCDGCGESVDNCICPECPKCGEQGNPTCYTEHGLRYNKKQRMGQSKLKIASLRENIADEEQYLAWLEDQPDDWKDEEQ